METLLKYFSSFYGNCFLRYEKRRNYNSCVFNSRRVWKPLQLEFSRKPSILKHLKKFIRYNWQLTFCRNKASLIYGTRECFHDDMNNSTATRETSIVTRLWVCECVYVRHLCCTMLTEIQCYSLQRKVIHLTTLTKDIYYIHYFYFDYYSATVHWGRMNCCVNNSTIFTYLIITENYNRIILCSVIVVRAKWYHLCISSFLNCPSLLLSKLVVDTLMFGTFINIIKQTSSRRRFPFVVTTFFRASCSSRILNTVLQCVSAFTSISSIFRALRRPWSID